MSTLASLLECWITRTLVGKLQRTSWCERCAAMEYRNALGQSPTYPSEAGVLLTSAAVVARFCPFLVHSSCLHWKKVCCRNAVFDCHRARLKVNVYWRIVEVASKLRCVLFIVDEFCDFLRRKATSAISILVVFHLFLHACSVALRRFMNKKREAKGARLSMSPFFTV